MQTKEWLESIFLGSEQKTEVKNMLLMSLSDPKGGADQVFDFDTAIEAIDWQMFTYILFRSNFKILKEGIDYTSNESFFPSIDQDSPIAIYLKSSGLESEFSTRVLDQMRIDVPNDADMKKSKGKPVTFKLNAFKTIKYDFELLNALRLKGFHWNIFSSSYMNGTINYGIKTKATHNPRDSDCSIPSSLFAYKIASVGHPYIGFSDSKRTSYPAGGGAPVAYEASIASLSVKTNRGTYTFSDYFSHEDIFPKLNTIGVPEEALSALNSICSLPPANIFADSIHHLQKQVYWMDKNKTLLVTPLMATSLQIDMSDYYEDASEKKDFIKLNACGWVKRILSNPQNAGVTMQQTRGRNYLLKCMPPEQYDNQDLYFYFSRVLKGELSKYNRDDLIQEANKIIYSKSKKDSHDEDLGNLLSTIANDVSKLVIGAANLCTTKGKDWMEGKKVEGNIFEMFSKFVFDEKDPETCKKMANIAVKQISSRHLSDKVIEKLIPLVAKKFEEFK